LPVTHSSPYSEHHTPRSTNQADPEGLLESLEFTGTNPGLPEDVLSWPIFGGEYDHVRAKIESLVFSPSTNRHASDPHQVDIHASHFIGADPVRSSGPGRGVREDDVLRLVNLFLVNVHIKNPVLDPDDLKKKARWTSEHGFSWDATSCLVLITCALATISSSFMADPVTPDLVAGPSPLSSVQETHEYSTAESYYIAAQKRIALLDNSIETTQCFFLSGVYEMYSLRPARAWTSFNRACITLQIYFKGQERHELQGSKGVVSRVFFSTLKSICELRMETNLPPSGLANVAYSDVFPTPPGPSDSAIASASASGSIEAADGDVMMRMGPRRGSTFSAAQAAEPDIEKIWSYYLSELAVRKIANRIMDCFYQDDETSWLRMSLDRMIRVADELELQISQWFENLPSSLTSMTTASNTTNTTSTTTTTNNNNNNNNNNPNNNPMSGGGDVHNKLATEELKFVLHARLSDLRERIYRPFLYLAIARPPSDPVQQTLAPFAQRCVDACVACLLRGTPRHRHHGTWYENRGMFLKSLLVVAAARSASVRVPAHWHQAVDLAVAGFAFWETEAPDLREARLVLQKLLEEFRAG
jgi:hypothetical protein